MTYIRAAGVHNSVPDAVLPDLKAELKALSGQVYRRIDHFIQLAVIGAHKTAAGRDLPKDTAIYMTSGQGNISVFDRVRDQRHFQKMLPKPVDFINLLSNSAGFYVATHLGIEGKNLFLAHHRFPVQMTMLAALNDVRLGKQGSILVGGVDEWIEKQELAKKLLGVGDDTLLGEGSNWILLGADPEGALGTFDMPAKAMDFEALARYVAALEPGTALAFSHRFTPDDIAALCACNQACSRYGYEAGCGYYETQAMYAMARFAAEERGRLVYIDGSGGRYMAMTVDTAQR